MKKVKLIVPVYNGVEYFKKMTDSLLVSTPEELYQLVVVDNGSTDGAKEHALALAQSHPDLIRVICNDKNYHFSGGNNIGLRAIEGEEWDYVGFVNSDLIFTKGWLEGLIECFSVSDNVGMVGPVSNGAGGVQGVDSRVVTYKSESEIPEFGNQWKIKNVGRHFEAGMLVGLCLLVSRQCMKDVGYWEEGLQMWQDNDLCLKGRLKGYRYIVDASTFIHHFFSKSFVVNKCNTLEIFNRDRVIFRSLWERRWEEKKQKLVGMCRVKNGAKYIEKTLKRISEFCDEIVILVDQFTTDNTIDLCKQFPKVIDLQKEEPHTYNESYSRNYVYEMAKRRNPDWIWCFDCDELPEDKIVSEIQHLMNPSNPEVMCWTFPIIQLWNSETHYRNDGLWGNFIQGRMFRPLPGSRIGGFGDAMERIHCGSHPWFPVQNIGNSLVRILHYGNIDKVERERKYRWYREIDTNKQANAGLILGPWVDYYKKLYGKQVLEDSDYYRHIVDETGLELKKFVEYSGISLCQIAKNESQYIGQCLRSVSPICTEMITIDTGSTDGTKEIAEGLGARTYSFTWNNNFSDARNLSLDKATQPWILRIDPDEVIDGKNIDKIWELTQDNSVDGYIFPIMNFLEDPKTTKEAKWVLSETCRLFKNNPKVRYGGLIHEELDDSFKTLAKERQVIIKKVPYPIYHFGYLRPEKFKAQKWDYYCKLGEEQKKLTPNDPRPYFSVAVHYFHVGDWHKAIENYKRTIELDPKHWMAYNDLGVIYYQNGDVREAKDCFLKAQALLNANDHIMHHQKLEQNLKAIEIKSMGMMAI